MGTGRPLPRGSAGPACARPRGLRERGGGGGAASEGRRGGAGKPRLGRVSQSAPPVPTCGARPSSGTRGGRAERVGTSRAVRGTLFRHAFCWCRRTWPNDVWSPVIAASEKERPNPTPAACQLFSSMGIGI
ncbi:translation initiation factor IF-2-like [Cervus elaphus]|uniref:translation initiation factor IF-2-like n=1 Tax=Cervus elaphus TaxID=9860 RepID=UPI001CC2D4D2|nr:translation initiation factor IF-2-like [Cervus elaphus]